MLAAPATVSLSATATDAGGPIGKVEFYRDTTLIATVTTPTSGTSTAGTYTAIDTNVPVGTYTVGTEIEGKKVFRSITVEAGKLTWVVFKP